MFKTSGNLLSEQERLVGNYLRETCAIQNSLHSNYTCNITMETSLINLTMMPCNFVPLQPHFYKGILFNYAATYLYLILFAPNTLYVKVFFGPQVYFIPSLLISHMHQTQWGIDSLTLAVITSTFISLG